MTIRLKQRKLTELRQLVHALNYCPYVELPTSNIFQMSYCQYQDNVDIVTECIYVEDVSVFVSPPATVDISL